MIAIFCSKKFNLSVGINLMIFNIRLQNVIRFWMNLVFGKKFPIFLKKQKNLKDGNFFSKEVFELITRIMGTSKSS